MLPKSSSRLLAVGLLILAMAGCGDLTVDPKSTVTSGNAFSDPSSYRAFLAKLYVGLATTGQEGPAGRPDILGIDEGFSQYVRGYWQLQQLPTDEVIIGWGDPGLPELNFQTWSASNVFITAMYSRIYYQIALANQFLRETTDPKLSSRGVGTALRETVQGYRAEARFLRALSYAHAMDLFGRVPLVDENFDVTQLPEQAERAEVFAFVESELKAVRPELPPIGRGEYYGRASQAAVDMLLARIYLNAKVYTGTARWTDARAAAEAVIANTQFSLDPTYLDVFSADNQTSTETIFVVPFDGLRTQTWGGMTFLAHAAVGDGMDPADYGLNFGWGGFRLRPQAVDRFTGGVGPGAPDQRARYIVTTDRIKAINDVARNRDGFAAPKYRNIKSTGEPGVNEDHPDTDFPMFRLAEAYLIYAEAHLQGGGGTPAQALEYINRLRFRAYGNTSGNITAAQLTLPFILDERSRELLWEGHRRQDLIRFDLFSANGVWAWKGNQPAGVATDRKYDLYPIPASELVANPKMTQNPGY